MLPISTRPKSPRRSEVIIKAIQPGPIYGDGVLIGNWVEDRADCPRTGTLYFPPKSKDVSKPESRLEDFRQNKLNFQQGTGLSRVLQHDSHVRCGNYTTTNELVYHHLPMTLCGPDMRYYKKSEHQWYPQPDLMKCYGDNLSKWGLRAHKHYEWACTDVSDYSSSVYEDTYIPPMMDQYLKAAERKPRDSCNDRIFPMSRTGQPPEWLCVIYDIQVPNLSPCCLILLVITNFTFSLA